MPSIVYNEGSYALQHGDVIWASDTIDILIVKSSYTPNKDDDHSVIAAAELSGVSGYIGGYGGSGRKTLGTKTFTNDTGADRTEYGAADPSAWTIGTGDTIGGFLVIKRGSANDSTATLLFYLGVTATPTNGSAVTVGFPSGIVSYTQQ